MHDALDAACDMTPAQIGRVSGLMLGLHGLSDEAVAALLAELSAKDRACLRGTPVTDRS